MDPNDEVRQPDYAPRILPTYGADTCNDANGDGVNDDLVPPGDVDACEYPNNRNYFRVTMRGTAGNASRQVQAIFIKQLLDFPFPTTRPEISTSTATPRQLPG